MPQCGALGTLVDGGGVGESGVFPWFPGPEGGGILMEVLSAGFCVFGPFCHILLLVHGLSGH